ncbi:MAG: ABC transporter permease [Planctomycetota bacterium]
MTRLIVARLIQLPLILAAVFAITFTLAWVVPGNPLDNPDGRRPDPEVMEAMKRQYNLDSPWSFLSSYVPGLFRGDLGPSLIYRDQTVADIIASGLPVSATLGVAALAFAFLFGTFAGVIGSMFPRTPLDLSSSIVSLIGVSLPSFVTGSVLLVVFGALLSWFPTGGWPGWPDLRFWAPGWGSYASQGRLAEDVGDFFGSLVLPAITLGLIPAAYVARLIRLGLADVMGSDFVRTAMAKGRSRRGALFGHALKVAMLPVLSFLGPAAAAAMTGSFVVEKIFNLPGLGEYFVAAARDKDQFLILGVVLVYSALLVVFNLVVDVAYAFVDPRIRVG